MKINRQNTYKKIIIDKYDDNGFIISGERIIGPIFVSENKYFKLNNNTIDLSIIIESLKLIKPVDILLVGSPDNFIINYKEILSSYKNLNIESMQTGSCCRTYNLLIAENRRVAAAIYPLKSN
ncbi:Mth938-like domain-containing protein [Alphaproteobacteria bacterium]|nr:Mth938-like domain-containing protein [Alphaproteobacteria bacterium]